MIENDWTDFYICSIFTIFVSIYFLFEFSIYIYFLDIYESNFSNT